jgi:hypothetical protein
MFRFYWLAEFLDEDGNRCGWLIMSGAQPYAREAKSLGYIAASSGLDLALAVVKTVREHQQAKSSLGLDGGQLL